MRKRIVAVPLITMFLAMALAASAQEKREEPMRNVYKLEFTVFELDNGKRINERSYMLQLSDDRRGANTRVGTRVPITIGSEKFGPSVQYMDVGLKIDANFQGADDAAITLLINFETSGFAVPEQSTQSGTPVLRNVSEQTAAKLPYGKPTLISSVDDVNSKRRLQLELTATRVK
jgi:hypothetical protein